VATIFTLLLYLNDSTFYKNVVLANVIFLFETHQHGLFQNPDTSAASVAPASRFRAFLTLLVLLVFRVEVNKHSVAVSSNGTFSHQVS
jgi:hypothetical protein